MIDARRESLPSILGVSSALGWAASIALRSKRKPRTAPRSAVHRAQTSSTSASGAFVIHVFDP